MYTYTQIYMHTYMYTFLISCLSRPISWCHETGRFDFCSLPISWRHGTGRFSKYAYTHMYMCTYIYVYVYFHVWSRPFRDVTKRAAFQCTNIYLCMIIFIYKYIYIYIYIYMYTRWNFMSEACPFRDITKRTAFIIEEPAHFVTSRNGPHFNVYIFKHMYM